MNRFAASLPALLVTSCLSVSAPPETALPRASIGELEPPTASRPGPDAPTATRSTGSLPAQESWTFALNPYLFASGLEGSVGTEMVSQGIDADFDELFDNLSMGAMLDFEASPPDSRWTILTNLMYVELEANGTAKGPAASPVSATIEQFIGELTAAFEVQEKGRLELLAGLRYWSLSTKMNADTPGGPESAEASKDWLDPLVGVRSHIPLAKRFDLLLRGDIGGFSVGSDFSYNLGAGVVWSASNVVKLALGYRYLYVDYNDDGFVYDVAQAGPLLGISFQF